MLKVYLAGPEVFLPGGRELIDRKREALARFGFEPTRRHADFMEQNNEDPRGSGEQISRLNERLMDGADLCIANLTPFRGISADVGTVFELGYMIAQRKPAYGFTNDPRDYSARATEHFGSTAVMSGRLVSPDGEMIEQHGMADNLMIDGGISHRGWSLVRAQTTPETMWTDLSAFHRILSIARNQLIRKEQHDNAH